MRPLLHLPVLLLIWACMANCALAAPAASLRVTFTPERLGHSTSMGIRFRIAAPEGRSPSPLAQLDFSYPSELGLSTSGLGMDSCPQQRLELFGAAACPADSRMGQGSALAEIPYGPRTALERVKVAVLRTVEQAGHPALLFYLTGTTPVIAQIALRGLLLPSRTLSEEHLRIDVPLVPVTPRGPDVALAQLQLAIGSAGLIYHERVHGKLIAYRPQGILLPDTCPRGGFAFHATFTFLDGLRARARTTVPCPAHRPRAHAG